LWLFLVLQNYILHSFGTGPYYVRFSLDIFGQGESFFVVEISTRKTFPLSVFTLLTLVESGFYNGVDVEIGGNGVLLVGRSVSGNSMDEKLKALGFLGGSSLYFPEEIPEYPCGPNFLGFVNRGPALHLHISSGGEEGYHTCFAEVVRGADTLQLIHHTLGNGESVTLSSAAVLLAHEEDSDSDSPDL
jgi:cyclophilin family peptidyl-prolyl cis-trans isomerase